jgi:ribonucleotide reductase alpha subunit
MLGLRYGDEASPAFAGGTMRTIRHAAYRQSIAIAEEKGRFPEFDRAKYLDARFVRALAADIRDVPAATSLAAFAPQYRLAYNKRLKDCTTSRRGATAGAVLRRTGDSG